LERGSIRLKQTGAPTACHEPHILSETVSHFSDARQRRETSTTHLAYAAAIHRRSIPQKSKTSYPVFSVPAFNFLLQMQGITVANELPEQAMGKHQQVIKKPAAARPRLA